MYWNDGFCNITAHDFRPPQRMRADFWQNICEEMSSEDEAGLQTLQDGQGRFRARAANIGAFQPPPSSQSLAYLDSGAQELNQWRRRSWLRLGRHRRRLVNKDDGSPGRRIPGPNQGMVFSGVPAALQHGGKQGPICTGERGWISAYFVEDREERREIVEVKHSTIGDAPLPGASLNPVWKDLQRSITNV
ncbi:hypothetical protein MKZ38_000544 [Zalerion maritima]|uniref:Uncharacterized protein n=1 Tax=Zalerion maritima TaxID=339359 RepID=A0AAD5WTP7_9PEZI|nr:hypothetical protein MKZ38_000544 [Zalerion maritima]